MAEKELLSLNRKTIIDKRYKIIRKIGSGAMGNVYLAKDLKLERNVAFKTINLNILRSESDLKEVKKRFYREARAAAILKHPNLTTVYDVGEYQGISYIIMEYVEGTTLEDLLKFKKKLSLEEAVVILNGILEGISEAHKKNIIHRDLKPSNIIISKNAEIKITDFGLAKPSFEKSITHSGTFIGTANYVSPEQTYGKRVDARSDLWSIGVIFYEMLTGKKLFSGGSLSEVILKVAQFKPTSVVLDLPQKYSSLITFFKKLLDPQIKNRPRNARGVKSLLKDILKSEKNNALIEERNLLNIESNILPSIRLGRYSIKANVEKNIPIEVRGFLAVITVFILMSFKSFIKYPKYVLKPKVFIPLILIIGTVASLYLLLFKKDDGALSKLDNIGGSGQIFKVFACLPFKNLSDQKDMDWYGFALQEEIITQLKNNTEQTKILDQARFTEFELNDTQRYMKDNKLDYLLTGSYKRDSLGLTLNTKLYINGKTNPIVYNERSEWSGSMLTLKRVLSNIIKYLDGESKVTEDDITISTNDNYSFEAFYKGKMAFNNQERDRAEVEFRNSIIRDNKYIEAYYYLGKTLKEKGQYNEAIKYFNQALDLSEPEDRLLWKKQISGNIVSPIYYANKQIDVFYVEDQIIYQATYDIKNGSLVKKIKVLNVDDNDLKLFKYDSDLYIFMIKNNKYFKYSQKRAKILWSTNIKYISSVHFIPWSKAVVYRKYTVIDCDNNRIIILDNSTGKIIKNIMCEGGGNLSYNECLYLYNIEDKKNNLTEWYTLNLKNEIDIQKVFEEDNNGIENIFYTLKGQYDQNLPGTIIVSYFEKNKINFKNLLSGNIDSVSLYSIGLKSPPFYASYENGYYFIESEDGTRMIDKITKQILWKRHDIGLQLSWSLNASPDSLLRYFFYNISSYDRSSGKRVFHYEIPRNLSERWHSMIYKDKIFIISLVPYNSEQSRSFQLLAISCNVELSNISLLNEIAECYIKLTDFEKAKIFLNRLIASGSENIKTILLLADIYKIEDNYDAYINMLFKEASITSAIDIEENSKVWKELRKISPIIYHGNITRYIINNKIGLSSNKSSCIYDPITGIKSEEFYGHFVRQSGNEHLKKYIYRDENDNLIITEIGSLDKSVINKDDINYSKYISESYFTDNSLVLLCGYYSDPQSLYIISLFDKTPKILASLNLVNLPDNNLAFGNWNSYYDSDYIFLFDCKAFQNNVRFSLLDLFSFKEIINFKKYEDLLLCAYNLYNFNHKVLFFSSMKHIIINTNGTQIPGRILVLEKNKDNKWSINNSIFIDDLGYDDIHKSINDNDILLESKYHITSYNISTNKYNWSIYFPLDINNPSLQPFFTSDDSKMILAYDKDLYVYNIKDGKISKIFKMPFSIRQIENANSNYAIIMSDTLERFLIDLNYRSDDSQLKKYISEEKFNARNYNKYMAGVSYYNNQQYAKAISIFNELSKNIIKYSYLRIYMFSSYILSGENSKADQVYKLLQKEISSEYIDKLISDIILNDFIRNKKEKALKLCQEAIKLIPKSGQLYRCMASMMALENNSKESLTYLHKSFEYLKDIRADFLENYYWDPLFQKIRDNKEYIQLFKKYGFELKK